MNSNFIYMFFVLILAMSSGFAENKNELKFTIKTLGVVTLKVEKKEILTEASKVDSAHPDAKEFDNKYIVDTYSLLSSDSKILWVRVISNPKVFFERREFSGLINNINILNVELLDEKIFVIYSTNNKVWVDEVLLNDKKEWIKNKQVEIMVMLHFSLIKKCEVSINDSNKKQVKIKFDIADKGEEIYLYENGVVKKIEK